MILFEKSWNDGKYVSVVQHMYEGSKTIKRCTVGYTE